jgi:hypothetical protein
MAYCSILEAIAAYRFLSDPNRAVLDAANGANHSSQSGADNEGQTWQVDDQARLTQAHGDGTSRRRDRRRVQASVSGHR